MSPTVPKVTHKSDGDEEAKLSTDGSRNGDTEDVALSFPQRVSLVFLSKVISTVTGYRFTATPSFSLDNSLWKSWTTSRTLT